MLHSNAIFFLKSCNIWRFITSWARRIINFSCVSFLGSNYGFRNSFLFDIHWTISWWSRSLTYNGHPFTRCKFSTSKLFLKFTDAIRPWAWNFAFDFFFSFLSSKFFCFWKGKLCTNSSILCRFFCFTISSWAWSILNMNIISVFFTKRNSFFRNHINRIITRSWPLLCLDFSYWFCEWIHPCRKIMTRIITKIKRLIRCRAWNICSIVYFWFSSDRDCCLWLR